MTCSSITIESVDQFLKFLNLSSITMNSVFLVLLLFFKMNSVFLALLFFTMNSVFLALLFFYDELCISFSFFSYCTGHYT